MTPEKLYVGDDSVFVLDVPDQESWMSQLKEEISKHRSRFRNSHKIKGRWENSYLDIDVVPSAKIPMRFARTVATEILGIKSALLFEPLPGSKESLPPFWFNIAKPGEITGLHDHANLSALSAVVYLQADLNAGNLYFEKDLAIEVPPVPGKIVLFPPYLKHGVRKNRSNEERISLAFNLFPFPLPMQNL